MHTHTGYCAAMKYTESVLCVSAELWPGGGEGTDGMLFLDIEFEVHGTGPGCRHS